MAAKSEAQVQLPFYIRMFLERMKQQFWLVPSLMVVLLVGLLMVSLQIPNTDSDTFWTNLFLRGYSKEGARLILSSIATALMTVIGVLFSLTIVVLQQVSSQYSPRVIEVFISSRASQVMLGLYLGTFVFCILLLRQIPGDVGEQQAGLPQISISAALGLALACIAFLIHYVHHIAHAIQSTHIIARIRTDSLSYTKAYDQFLRKHKSNSEKIQQDRQYTSVLKSEQFGYLQSIEFERIDRILKGVDAIAEIEAKPGDYLQKDQVVATVRSGITIGKKHRKTLMKAIRIGETRTHAQDVRYGIRQLVDISLRALSPGINDPSTAIEAVNAIGSLAGQFAKHCRFPKEIVLPNGTVARLGQVEFTDILELSFNQLLVAAKDHATVLLRISEILEEIRGTCSPERQEACDHLQKLSLAALAQADGHSYYGIN